MDAILDFLLAHCSFLWKDNRFRIKDSFVTSEGNGVAELTLESDSLRLIFIRERGFLSLALQSREEARNTQPAFNFPHVWTLLTGAPAESPDLEDFVELLRENLDETEAMFRSPRYPKVKAELEEIRRKWAEEAFGQLPEGEEDT